MDKKHIKKGGPDETNEESIPSQRDDTSSMNKTNKRVVNQKPDKPGVIETEHVTEPNVKLTTIKGEKKALAEKLVNTTDPFKGKDNGDEVEGIGGTLGIVLANSVMLFMTMLLLLLPYVN